MTGEQLRAARAMLQWEQAELAKRAEVSAKTIKRLESVAGPLEARSIYSIQQAFELAGIEFLDKDDLGGRGDGVRFHSDRTAKMRRAIATSVALEIDIALLFAVRGDENFFERPIAEVKKLVLNLIADKLEESIVAVVPQDV